MEVEIQSATGSSSMIKQLVLCKKTARDRALKLFLSWLPNQTQISDKDMKKIWKGLFYCVWHADKAPVQAELNERLSSFILSLPRSLAAQYFSTFLLTMHREWFGIDSLRLDKFYHLIRRFLYFCFLFLKNNSWNLELSREFIGILGEQTFLSQRIFSSNGVGYHVVSVFLEELKHALPVSKVVLEVLFLPFCSAMRRSSDKVLVSKIRSNVFSVLGRMGRRLLEAKKSGVEIDAGSEVVVYGTIALIMNFSSKFYELGSSTDCVQGNRKVLFNLHEEFLKLEKDAESSGIDISIPEVNNNDNEAEVPNLVPIVAKIEGDASEGTHAPAGVDEPGKALAKKKPKKGKKKPKKGKKKTKELEMKKENSEEVKAIEDVTVPGGVDSDGDFLISNETVISNLQSQFEKVAEDAGLDVNSASLCAHNTVNGNGLKKRKRAKSLGGMDSQVMCRTGEWDGAGENGGVKSTKKVKFSMKSNLVWTPRSPLPPQSLRLPPSATPRGSALKKGVPPGPIREFPTKKAMSKILKGQKSVMSVSPTIKRLKQLKYFSV